MDPFSAPIETPSKDGVWILYGLFTRKDYLDDFTYSVATTKFFREGENLSLPQIEKIVRIISTCGNPILPATYCFLTWEIRRSQWMTNRGCYDEWSINSTSRAIIYVIVSPWCKSMYHLLLFITSNCRIIGGSIKLSGIDRKQISSMVKWTCNIVLILSY